MSTVQFLTKTTIFFRFFSLHTTRQRQTDASMFSLPHKRQEPQGLSENRLHNMFFFNNEWSTEEAGSGDEALTETQMKGLKVADMIQLVLSTGSTDPMLYENYSTASALFFMFYCFATLNRSGCNLKSIETSPTVPKPRL